MRSRRLSLLPGAGALLFLISFAALPALSAVERVSLAPEEKAPAAPMKLELRVPTEAERKAVATAIEEQLKAFRADDFEKALKYQSVELGRNSLKPDAFRRMMRESYPQFVNYRSVSFGEARATPDGDVVQILASVTGQDGKTVRALYIMVKEAGEYRVGSVLGGVQRKPNPKDVV